MAYYGPYPFYPCADRNRQPYANPPEVQKATDGMQEVGYLTREDRPEQLALFGRRGLWHGDFEYAYTPTNSTVSKINLNIRRRNRLVTGDTVALPGKNDGVWVVHIHPVEFRW